MSSSEENAASQWLRETQKGYLRIVVLILLSKKPHYGYEIMKEIKEKTMGFWRPTPGGIYPVLQSLEKSGYVEGKWGCQTKRRRKTYAMTEAGGLVLERALAKESQIADSMNNLMGEFMKDVLDVEMKPPSIHARPPFFSIFLENGEEGTEDTMRVLEVRRAHIEDVMKQLQKGLDTIDERLVRLNRLDDNQNPLTFSHRRRQ
jgi:DNA-binding PadR family transcriptional regulator